MERQNQRISCGTYFKFEREDSIAKTESYFKNDPDVKDTLRRLHDDFVLVPADKAANNVIVVCKKYICIYIYIYRDFNQRIGHQHP